MTLNCYYKEKLSTWILTEMNTQEKLDAEYLKRKPLDRMLVKQGNSE